MIRVSKPERGKRVFLSQKYPDWLSVLLKLYSKRAPEFFLGA
jgi:hypothetical protein